MPTTIHGNRAVSDPVLTKVAQGYGAPENLIATKILPLLDIGAMSAKLPRFGKEAFMIHNTKRGIGGQVARMTTDNDVLTVVTEEHSLNAAIDDQELLADHAKVINLQMRRTEAVQGSLFTEMENEIATAVLDAAIYANSNKATKTTTGRWHLDSADPLGDIDTARNAVRDAIGRYPNTILFGASAWRLFKKHSQVTERLTITKNKIVTQDDTAQLVEIPNVLVGMSIKASAAGTFSDIWKKGNNHIVWMGWVPPSPDRNEPAFGYCARNVQGMMVERFREAERKGEVIQVTDYWKPQILGPGAGYLLQIEPA